MEEKKLAEDLSTMLRTAIYITTYKDLTKETLSAAEDCVRSLLKSMAILGYDKVANNKEQQ